MEEEKDVGSVCEAFPDSPTSSTCSSPTSTTPSTPSTPIAPVPHNLATDVDRYRQVLESVSITWKTWSERSVPLLNTAVNLILGRDYVNHPHWGSLGDAAPVLSRFSLSKKKEVEAQMEQVNKVMAHLVCVCSYSSQLSIFFIFYFIFFPFLRRMALSSSLALSSLALSFSHPLHVSFPF